MGVSNPNMLASVRIARRLAETPGEFVSRQDLLVAAYGEDDARWPYDCENILRVIICALRKKYPDSIGSMRLVGYVLQKDSILHKVVLASMGDPNLKRLPLKLAA